MPAAADNAMLKNAAADANPDADARAIRKNLGLGRSRIWKHLTTLLLLAGAAVGIWFLYQYLNQPTPPPNYLTATVDRGDISTIVSATGTVEPVRIVEVGPEISGRIIEVTVSENDVVTKGQVLARFDTEPLQARFEQARANLDVASARLIEVRATVREASQTNKRVKILREGGINAERESEAVTATLSRARASLLQAEAQERSAKAQVTQVETDLARAVLYSPIDGVVLTRAVEPGKAVASALQTPVLFTIAEDLTHMELRLAIDEADVAQVKPGLKAEFTVDAYPKQTFPATVAKVHLAPTVVQNLVTYEAILAVDNSALLLFPGMTATANITASTVNNVMRVPNAALRFSPPRDRPATSSPTSMMPGMGGRPPGGSGRPAGATGAAGGTATNGESRNGEGSARVFVLEDGKPRRVRVTIGATDGRFTEIQPGEISGGDKVLIGIDPNPPSAEGPTPKTAPGSDASGRPTGNDGSNTRRRPSDKATNGDGAKPADKATNGDGAKPADKATNGDGAKPSDKATNGDGAPDRSSAQ